MFKIFILISLISIKSFAFFDSITSEAANAARGAAITTTLLDEMGRISSKGEDIDIEEIKSLSVRYNDKARELNDVYSTISNIESEYENIESTNNIFKKASNSIKSINRIVNGLCALGPDSCQVATSYINYQEQRETNRLLLESIKSSKIKDLKSKIAEAKKKSSTANNIKAISNLKADYLKYLEENL